MPELGRLNQINQDSVKIINVKSGEIRIMREQQQSVVISNIAVDTTENWNNKITYIPKCGTIIVYSDRNIIDGVNYPGIKIADGTTYVVDLPFVGDDIANQIQDILNRHINDSTIHVTLEEKEFWNNKLNYEVQGEILTFNTN